MNKLCLSVPREKKINFGLFNKNISADSKFSKIARTNANREPWLRELNPLTTSKSKNIRSCGKIPMVTALEYFPKLKIES